MKVKRLNRFVLVLILALGGASQLFGMDITPRVVGNGTADSVFITFTSIDTTYYPVAANLDALIIIRFNPDGSNLDSTHEGSANVFNPRTGYYRAAFKASNGSGAKGLYIVLVRGWRAGQIRGIATGSYEVVEQNADWLMARAANLDATVSSRGTSDLIDSDNIGIDWGDIINQSSPATLSQTLISFVTSVYRVTNLGIEDTLIRVLMTDSNFARLATAEDYKGGEGTGTPPSDIYSYFTSGSNEDAFKAPGTSTFDQTSDPVIVGTNNDKLGYSLTPGAITTTTFGPGAINANVIATDAITSDELAQSAANLTWLDADSPWSKADADSVLARSTLIVKSQNYRGAYDGFRQVYFPGDTTFVDSTWIVEIGATPDSIRATIYFLWNGTYPAGTRFEVW